MDIPELIVTIFCSIVASTGLWTFIQKLMEKKDDRSKMLVGLAHDRIIYLGMQYIKRGWITQDEYENLYDYLYVPYHNMGGNGSAERVIHEVQKLPLKGNDYDEMRGPEPTTKKTG